MTNSQKPTHVVSTVERKLTTPELTLLYQVMSIGAEHLSGTNREVLRELDRFLFKAIRNMATLTITATTTTTTFGDKPK